MAFSGILLRPHHESDFETLYTIDQSCFPKRIAYGRYELNSYLRSPGSRCTVAEVGGTIAGFIVTECSGELAHIITLDVLEPYRRRSIGSRLLESAEREAAGQGARLMYLETATTNKPAIALWKKHGYRQSGVVGNYYGQGHDALEMEKLLRPKPEDTRTIICCQWCWESSKDLPNFCLSVPPPTFASPKP